ncbi:hypothetical protein E5288_WYG000799 [Bos mutus]|uniref:Uncharacterized protein n=1 Tax=Bos mutus TaxID=72004 RepID=A0A6B0RMY9_9CETA|nr:hypothetical protein [Bos mutus]
MSFLAGIYGPRSTNPPPRVPSLFPSSRFGSVLALQSRGGSLPPPQTVPGLRSPVSDRGNRTSHLQPKMVAPAHVPSRDHKTGASVPNPPLPPPGSFSTATPGCPTHSHPHWASSTPVTTAPRPTGPFARPSPREDVSNPNEATFPRIATVEDSGRTARARIQGTEARTRKSDTRTQWEVTAFDSSTEYMLQKRRRKGKLLFP